MYVIPAIIFDQIGDNCAEGLALALASSDDGAVMEVQWCNNAFCSMTGYESEHVIGQRGTILIGTDMTQGDHLRIIEELMNWEHFSIPVLNNRKNGEQYRQRMTWTPLSDPETGNRWWLCSLIELETQHTETSQQSTAKAEIADQVAYVSLTERVQSLERENARLHKLAKSVAKDANEDALTGLSNRRHFEIELTTWVERLRTNGTSFAALYIDLDRFKFVNDTLGHDAGDKLLVTVADILRGLTDKSDLVARLGGDEFVVLKELGASALNISSLADEIVSAMKSPVTFGGKLTSCTASIGLAIASANMDSPERVVDDADTALYHAKSQGKARWSFFTEEMHAESIATKQLVSDLIIACEKQEFVLFFQPLIDAVTGRIACAEVLVRWQHPTRGLLLPGDFLGTAENIGLLKTIDEIVFNGLGDALAFFDDANVDLPQVGFNLSPGRLIDPTLIHDIKTSGIDPKRLTVELLESVYLEKLGDVVNRKIQELDDLGITIAIDDFGTGHASVQVLQAIRPSILKIDRQFIQAIVESTESRALVLSIIGIGKSLGLKIVAEGVESEEHARLLIEMGCDYLQGFHFGKPMCAVDLRERLIETNGFFFCPNSLGRRISIAAV
jgi:diguanylate cyclase (GGDEF)-like protein/PAS domain S-box-containing protein